MEAYRRFYRQAILSYKGLFGFFNLKAYILVMILNPFSQLLFFSMLASHIYGREELAGYIAANALLLCVMSSVFGMMSVITADRGMGTLPLVMVTPANKALLFFSRSVPHIVNGIWTAFLGLLFGIVIFKVSISFSIVPFLLCIWLVSIFSACGLGLIIASCSLWTSSMHLVSNLIASLLLLLSGANYALSVMPGWLVKVAEAFPLTRGVHLTKSIVNEGDDSAFTTLLIEEFFLGVLLFTIGFLSIKLAEYLSRKKGSMELS
ncbi:MAG: ABC transporter permease [Lysinibacillus sp.]